MEDILYFAEGLVPLLAALPLYFYLILRVYPHLTLRLRGDRPRGWVPWYARWAAAGGALWRSLGSTPRPPMKQVLGAALSPAMAGTPSAAGDRGLRRVTFKEGRAVVYEPTPAARRYVPAYALIKREGRVHLLLRLNPRVAYIRYDVLCFDSRGRLLDLLQVSERVTAAGESRPVRLPTATVYTRVVPRRVDKMYEDHSVAAVYSLGGMAVYAALVTLTTAAVGSLWNSFLWSRLSTLPYGSVGMPASTALGRSLLVGLLTSAALLGLYHRHIRRRVNR